MNNILSKFSFFLLTAVCCLSAMNASVTKCDVLCADDDIYLIEDPCYSSTPLHDCGWNLSIKGGIAPTEWLNRGDAYIVVPTAVPPVISIGRVKSYENQFDLPWVAGLELAYNTSGYTQTFVEGLYRCSHNKHNLKKVVSTELTVTEKMDDAREWFGYFGARRFFSRDWISDSVAPYIGFKAGFVHHQKIRMKVYENLVRKGQFTLFESTTGISAGAHIGLDCALMESLSLQLQGEVVVSQAIQGKRNIAFPVDPKAPVVTNAIAGRVNSEVSFPITVALRYSF